MTSLRVWSCWRLQVRLLVLLSVCALVLELVLENVDYWPLMQYEFVCNLTLRCVLESANCWRSM